MSLYRVEYKVRGEDRVRRVTFTATSDNAAIESARKYQLKDKLNSVQSLRTKQHLLLEV